MGGMVWTTGRRGSVAAFMEEVDVKELLPVQGQAVYEKDTLKRRRRSMGRIPRRYHPPFFCLLNKDMRVVDSFSI